MLFLGGWSGPGVAYLTGLNSLGWGFLGNILALFYFITKIYGLCVVFIWVRSTLPRLRADQLMQFAWLILIPTTLLNILITGAIYLIMNALGFLGSSTLPFLIVLGVVNWIMLYFFIRIVGRATVATTRRAQAPAIRAQRRAATAQLPERAGAGPTVATSSQQ
jgi:NADH-quinone oxidoreductase subunit H